MRLRHLKVPYDHQVHVLTLLEVMAMQMTLNIRRVLLADVGNNGLPDGNRATVVVGMENDVRCPDYPTVRRVRTRKTRLGRC